MATGMTTLKHGVNVYATVLLQGRQTLKPRNPGAPKQERREPTEDAGQTSDFSLMRRLMCLSIAPVRDVQQGLIIPIDQEVNFSTDSRGNHGEGVTEISEKEMD